MKKELVKLLSRYSSDWMEQGYSLIDYLLVHRAYYRVCNVYGQLQQEIAEYFKKFPDERELADKDKFGRNYLFLAKEVQSLLMSVEDFYMELTKALLNAYPSEVTSNGNTYKLKLITTPILCESYKLALGDNPIEMHERIMSVVETNYDNINVAISKFVGVWEQFETKSRTSQQPSFKFDEEEEYESTQI